MIIQIYAFTNPRDAIQAVEAGVDHIGFVAGKYGEVFGELDFEEAGAMVREIARPACSVALTMSTDIEEILRMADAVRPDIVHVSSETDAVDIEAMARLRKGLGKDIRLMKAIGVMDQSSIQTARQFAEVSDILLLDTKIQHMPGVGATGVTHDWNISREIVVCVRVPVILAGGLNAGNVQTAIKQVNPWGVDSNTSTNIPGSPYLKDLNRVIEFVNAIRRVPEEDI